MTGLNGGTTTALLAILLLVASHAQAVSDADKCEAAKNKIAGKYALCRQKAEAKAIKSGEPVDDSKCDMKYADKWLDAEAAAVGMCPTNGDATPIQMCITAHTDDIAGALNGGACGSSGFLASGQTTSYGPGSDGDVQAGTPLSYTDNGDGTITDNNTGLMWEKKDDSGGIHDVDNDYTWCVDATFDSQCDDPNKIMDGTIVTTFLAALNNGTGFAGHTDWRIPNVKELLSVVDHERVNPAIDPMFHQATCTGCTDVTAAACSCTAFGTVYVTSTTWIDPVSGGEDLWFVDFTSGLADLEFKRAQSRVRAVRGGL